MGAVNINGVRLNVQNITRRGKSSRESNDFTTGNPCGENLLMVHGIASNMGYWMTDYVDALAEHFHITLVDMRGHGRSASPSCGYDPRQLGLDLCELIKSLDCAPVHIVAHSFGGISALNLALDHPDLVASLVILDTLFGDSRGSFNVFIDENKFQSALKDEGMNIPADHPFVGLMTLVELSKRKLDGAAPAPKDPQVAFLLKNLPVAAARKWLNLVENTDAMSELCGNDNLNDTRLSQLQTPLLAMYGDKSRALSSGKTLAEKAPHAALEIIPNAGHFFARTQPELVLSHCLSFWKNLGAVSPSLSHKQMVTAS